MKRRLRYLLAAELLARVGAALDFLAGAAWRSCSECQDLGAGFPPERCRPPVRCEWCGELHVDVWEVDDCGEYHAANGGVARSPDGDTVSRRS